MLIKNGKEKEINNYMDTKYTLVLVYADWCGACSMVKPILEEIESEREDLNLIELNVDENQQIVLEKQIPGTPATFFYKDGNEYDRLEGFAPKEEILRRLK